MKEEATVTNCCLSSFKKSYNIILQQGMSRLPLGFYGLFAFVCTYTSVQSLKDNWRTVSFFTNGYGLEDQVSLNDEDRKTRTTALAIKGYFAVNKLLKDAKKVKTYSQQFRKYEKDGDVNTAIEDFYSIKPESREIMNIGIQFKSKPGTVLTGLAGDRRVVLLLGGDKWSQGRPVLEVIDTKTKTMPNIDRIVYKKEK